MSSPSVRTPMAARRAFCSSGQRNTASGRGLSRAGNTAGSVMKQRAPARAATSAASAVGASVKCGAARMLASTGSARQASRRRRHNSRKPPNRLMLGLISSSRPSGGSMETCGVNVAAMPASRCMSSLLAHRIARPRIDAGRGRERRAQRHADAHPAARRFRSAVDDALVVISGSTITTVPAGRGTRGCRRTQCAAMAAAAHARRSTTRAARARARPGVRPAAPGRRRRRPHP